jgi:hypothetical protein
MKVKSTHHSALILPNGQVAPANRQILVNDIDWGRMVENPKVKSWVAGRYLVAEPTKVENTDVHRRDPPKGRRKQDPAGGTASAVREEEG